jgi:hypothetical protein
VSDRVGVGGSARLDGRAGCRDADDGRRDLHHGHRGLMAAAGSRIGDLLYGSILGAIAAVPVTIQAAA